MTEEEVLILNQEVGGNPTRDCPAGSPSPLPGERTKNQLNNGNDEETEQELNHDKQTRALLQKLGWYKELRTKEERRAIYQELRALGYPPHIAQRARDWSRGHIELFIKSNPPEMFNNGHKEGKQ